MHIHGKPHPTLQQYDCSAKDLEALLKSLPDAENPLANWKTKTELETATIEYSNLSSWIPHSEHQSVFHSFQDPNDDGVGSRRASLTYSELHEYVKSCPDYQSSNTMVVAVLLPPCMMAEMATVMLSLLAKDNVCVAPLDYNMPVTKLREAFRQLQCRGLVTDKDMTQKINNEQFSDLRIITPRHDKVGAVDWNIVFQEPFSSDEDAVDEYGDHVDRPVMLLRTSGTTSVPKVVPLTGSALLYNATCIASSLQLKSDDVGCNAMPLFHIGGIACALLSVLISGSSIVMMGQFDPESFLDCLQSEGDSAAIPSWLYGVPSMHKALLLTAKARLLERSEESIPNRLRFVRSGAAHLPHETAIELSKVLHTKVIPTYSMTESMPVCSSHYAPVVWNQTNANVVPNSVGYPIGCSVRIVNELGNTLPYGVSGEVALSGPGVMQGYLGVESTDSHTQDGWLRTGDVGQMDESGSLKLCGRSKEMIKRGGDQVWPNEVDRLVGAVPGVNTAVTFGVPNEMWGEEVAVAVVLDQDATAVDSKTIETFIFEICRENLDSSSVPSQIVFVDSTHCLLKGPTGKYLRSGLADHLNVQSVDNGALNVLNTRAHVDDESPTRKSISPSSALNGVRLITALFVVQMHVGLLPNAAWTKIQFFSVDMPIFFALGGFQLACSIQQSVCGQWSQWVGTKIGTMHSLFVVTQLIALPSYLLFKCGENGYAENIQGSSCEESMKGFIPLFLLQTFTGVVPSFDSVNPPAWFQSAFYMFLLLFPSLDGHLRKIPSRGLIWRLVLNLSIATFFFIFIHNFILEFTVIGWLPTLVSAMIAGYFFSRHAVDNDADACTLFQRPMVQGVIADVLSIAFVLIEVATAMSPGCFYMDQNTLDEMRPGEPLPDYSIDLGDGTEYYYVCEVTYDEFVEYIHGQSNDMYYGRWPTPIAGILGWYRVATPLVLLWIYALAHGRGLTARLMNLPVVQWLSPLAYPLYLLHTPMARYYWMATRGLEAEDWWPYAPSFPFPVQWFELLIIIAISLLVGFILDRTIVASLTRYTVWLGVKICNGICKYFGCCCRCCNCGQGNNATNSETTPSSSSSLSNYELVQGLIENITGNDQVTMSTNLKNVGLDSLGTTALLGTLRNSVPAARKLTVRQLAKFETVGDLVNALDAIHVVKAEEDIDRTTDASGTGNVEETSKDGEMEDVDV